jgi:hypothetical protein
MRAVLETCQYSFRGGWAPRQRHTHAVVGAKQAMSPCRHYCLPLLWPLIRYAVDSRRLHHPTPPTPHSNIFPSYGGNRPHGRFAQPPFLAGRCECAALPQRESSPLGTRPIAPPGARAVLEVVQPPSHPQRAPPALKPGGDDPSNTAIAIATSGLVGRDLRSLWAASPLLGVGLVKA